MNRFFNILYPLVLCILTGTTVYLLKAREEKKVIIADAVRLVDQYSMKKELEIEAKKRLEKINAQADSIGTQLQMANASHNSPSAVYLSRLYQEKKEQLEKEYALSNKEINEQIWKRLNAAVDAFGKERKVHLILGANGMGSILFSDGYYDVTDELITYVNRKYEEGN